MIEIARFSPPRGSPQATNTMQWTPTGSGGGGSQKREFVSSPGEVNAHHAYSSSYACAQCGAHGEQVWINMKPESTTYGLCGDCRNPMSNTALVTSTPIPAALTAERESAVAKLAAIRTITISTPAQKIVFAGALADVQTLWKKFDAQEKEITRPLLRSVESARATYRDVKFAYGEIEACIKE